MRSVTRSEISSQSDLCTVGNDTRKAVVDGWPAENVVASDLREGLLPYITNHTTITNTDRFLGIRA